MQSIARIYVEVDLKAAEHLAREHGCGATYVSIFGGSMNNMGYNACGEMSAALGVAQLGRIEELLAKRERVAG
ncbi:MAG: DegT/DnrJ/EryC1/StrS family aminotransferase, partial [Chloroflexota bacterium]